MNTLFIASDHAGTDAKEIIVRHLTEKNIAVEDLGTFGTDSVDYPDYAHRLAVSVGENPGSAGILLCGTGNGVCITANKHTGIRAGLAWKLEIARLIRQHNDANVMCLPARHLTADELKACTDAFLETDFEGGRHQNRVLKIENRA